MVIIPKEVLVKKKEGGGGISRVNRHTRIRNCCVGLNNNISLSGTDTHLSILFYVSLISFLEAGNRRFMQEAV